jgi:hypothetical protein
MPDKKISALDAIVTIATDDVLPIVDTSASTTKKISIAQIKSEAPVQSVASKTGAVTLVKGDVGLGNVDNTADTDKPISSATQSALNAKQATLVSGTNIKTINGDSLLGSGNITISGGGGISDGDKGDITVSASGATWTIDNGVVTDAKLSTGIDAAKLADGTVSNSEFQYLNGVTSAIQTQLDGKVDENSAITGATKTKITYDAKGLVTAGADLAATDLPSGIDATKIADGSVTNAEFQYLGSVTSDIQTQLNGKQATITGAATTIDTEDLTDSRALVSDGSGKVAVSSVTSTELGYVSGVTSAVQTQVDSKTAKLITTNRQTASYTLVLSDADKLVEMNVGSANNLTIPLNSSVAFPTGTQILLAQYGSGQTTVVATSGVTIRSNGGKLKLNVQYSGATLIKIGTDEWYLFGDIVS